MIMDYFYYSIVDDIVDVLNDSDSDPHYSAVHTTNKIILYLECMKEVHGFSKVSTVREYFELIGYDEEFNEFETKRKRESEYFEGVQLAER